MVALVFCLYLKINWFWFILSGFLFLVSLPIARSIIIDDVRYYLIKKEWSSETYNWEERSFGITTHKWGGVRFYSAISDLGERVIIALRYQKATYGQDFDINEYPEGQNTEKYSLSSKDEILLEKRDKRIKSIEKRIKNLQEDRKKLTSRESQKVDLKIKKLFLELEQ